MAELPKIQGRCKLRAPASRQPSQIAQGGTGGHEAEDARLADAGAVNTAEDSHGRRDEHACREPLHRARHEEEHLQPRGDGRGRDRVPQGLPEERADHEGFGRHQIHQRAGDDDGEAAWQHRCAQEPRYLGGRYAQGVAKDSLRHGNVADQECRDELATRASDHEEDLGGETWELWGNSLGDRGAGAAVFFGKPTVHGLACGGSSCR